MDSTRLREQFLVLRAQVGDDDAFADLFRLFGEKTLRYLIGLAGDGVAEDLQQDVWLTVYRRIGSITNPAAFRTWLFQTTRNQALDHLRRMRREMDFQAEAESLSEAETEDGDAEEIDIDSDVIAALMTELSPQHREVLVLRFWKDLTYPEMALVIGAPVGTVRSRLFHAKRLLRERLAAERPSHSPS